MTFSAQGPRIVALLNQKGGVGKTTSTANLGAAFAVEGLRTLVVDLDPQSNLSLHFGHEQEMDQRSVRDLFVDESVPASACIRSARERLDFIASDTELALVEGELAMRPGMQRILAERLAPVLGNYDIVLLDCPPSLGVLSVNALTMAHEVIVPMQAQYLALRGLEKLLETVLLVERSLNPGITVGGVLLCMHESQSSHGRAVVEEIDRYFARHRGDDVPWRGAQVLKPPVRRNIKLAEAPSFGQTIFDYSPKCAGAADYRALARGMLARWRGTPAADAVATESALASQ